MHPDRSIERNLDAEGLGVGHSSGVVESPWPTPKPVGSGNGEVLDYTLNDRATATTFATHGAGVEFGCLQVHSSYYDEKSPDEKTRLRRLLPDLIQQTELALDALRLAAAIRGIEVSE